MFGADARDGCSFCSMQFLTIFVFGISAVYSVSQSIKQTAHKKLCAAFFAVVHPPMRQVNFSESFRSLWICSLVLQFIVHLCAIFEVLCSIFLKCIVLFARAYTLQPLPLWQWPPTFFCFPGQRCAGDDLFKPEISHSCKSLNIIILSYHRILKCVCHLPPPPCPTSTPGPDCNFCHLGGGKPRLSANWENWEGRGERNVVLSMSMFLNMKC